MTPTKTQTRGTAEGNAAANRIREFRQNVNNGATAKEARATLRDIKAGPTTPVVTPTPVPTTPGPITTATLAPTTPMKLGEPTPATQATGMMEEFADTNDTYTRDLEAKAEALNAPAKTAFADYLSQLQNAKGQTQLTSEAYAQEGGVDAITPELNDINDKIRREQLNMRRRTEAIQAGGGLKIGAASEIANIERESFAKQADLSIIQLAVQGRYDSAKEIADRAVTAQFEQQANDLAILKFNYEENKELFTKAEQRAFEAAQGDRERKLTEERENAAQIKQFALTALQAGASTAEVQKAMSAKTLDEAISLVGGYLRPKPVAKGSSKPSITEIDGKPFIWDETTGQYVPAGEYIKGGGVDTEQSQQLTETLSLARTLRQAGATGKGSAVGASLAKFIPFGQSLGLQGDRTAFENKVNTLKANLTLDNLSLLKGPMSDKDLAFLQSVGSSLTTDMSQTEFDKELDKVIGKLQKAQGVSPIPFSQTQPVIGAQNVLRLPDQVIIAPNQDRVIITD